MSHLIAAPCFLMSAAWTAMFFDRQLGYDDAFKPVLLCLFLLSLIAAAAGIIRFLVSSKSRHIVACLICSVLALVLNVVGILVAVAKMHF